MKFLKSMIIGMMIFISIPITAQISVGVNIGSPPMWGPVGYTGARYYYLPDVESYYDVNASMFIYLRNGVWIRRAYLPSRYRDYDLYSGYKVVMRNYRGNTPYNHFNEHRMKYARGYRGEAQRTIGERNQAGSHQGQVFHTGKTYNRVDPPHQNREQHGIVKNINRGQNHGGEHTGERNNEHR